jgi:osmoprotectant transport system ATP-binding protein
MAGNAERNTNREERALIKLENVTKKYPDGTVAVKNFSLEIEEGEFCVFLGPSGCGKTTCMKMINRIIPLTEGDIYVQGENIMDVNQNELRRGIGYAIQNIGLFPHLTVAQNIATVPILKKWTKTRQRERAEELLALVGMDPKIFMDRYPSELSGGQQQRVGVARCLGADPPILLMDEPFGAIDPITRVKLQDEFLKIQAKIKKTIAFVTHDIHEAIKMGDRIALLKAGELVQFADPTTLLYAPENQFVRDFVGTDRVLKGLRLHRANEIMQKPHFTVRADEAPADIQKQMEKEVIRWSMAVDPDNRFLGWVTYDDIKTAENVRDIIVPPSVTADPDTPLNDALSLMLNSAIGTLAVVDENEKLLGVISFNIIHDILTEQIEDDRDIEKEDKS